NAGNVVDRLFRIKLGALAAGLVEDVDKVRLDVEQAKLEHGEQADRPRADNQHIGFDRFAHSFIPVTLIPYTVRSSPRNSEPVGWVERSETHRLSRSRGFRSAQPTLRPVRSSARNS